MSEWNRTQDEYLKRYAKDYCDGDIEKANSHEMVKEVLKGLKDERVEK
jgi:hypothetical protein